MRRHPRGSTKRVHMLADGEKSPGEVACSSARPAARAVADVEWALWALAKGANDTIRRRKVTQPTYPHKFSSYLATWPHEAYTFGVASLQSTGCIRQNIRLRGQVRERHFPTDLRVLIRSGGRGIRR
eukprot:6190662-Pleurochrysis_carterae.AAC.1